MASELCKHNGNFPETAVFERYAVKTSERANMHNHSGLHLDLISLLCVPWRHKKSQRRVYIYSHMLSTTVASPCQTLHELLAGDHK